MPKSPEDIGKMRIAGRLAAEVLDLVSEHVRPGITTAELDALCHDHIVNVQGAIPLRSTTTASRSRSAPQ